MKRPYLVLSYGTKIREGDTLARTILSQKSGTRQNKGTKKRKTATVETVTVSHDTEDDGDDILDPSDSKKPESDVEELGDGIVVGSYVICNVPTKTRDFYCVGCVEEENLDSYRIKSLEKSKELYKFTFRKKCLYRCAKRKNPYETTATAIIWRDS